MGKYKELKEMFFYKGYNKRVIKLILLLIFGLIVDVTAFPYFTKQILDVEIPNGNISGIIIFGAMNIITTMFSCYVVLKYCMVRFNIRRCIENDLREDVFKKLQEIETSFYDKNTTGDILQLLSNDTDDSSKLFSIIFVEMVVMGLLRMSVLSILLLLINFEIGIGIILIYLIGVIITILINKKTVNMLRKIRIMNASIINSMNEGIEGFTTIKTLSIEKEQIEKLEKGIDTYNIAQNKLNKIVTSYNVIFEMVSAFTMVWLLLKGTISLQTGVITYGIIMIIIDWTKMIKSESRFFLRHLTDFNKSYIAFYKILDFIKDKKVEDLDSGERLENIKEIEFKDVSFSYEGSERVIKNFNLKASKKEQVALVR